MTRSFPFRLEKVDRSPGGGGGTSPKFVRGCAQENKFFHPAPEFLPSNDRPRKKSTKSILKNTTI